MPEDSPWPLRDGYIHPEAKFGLAVAAQVDGAGPIVPLGRKELADFRRRDVGAYTLDAVIAEVTTNDDETVSLRLDDRTAAVAVYAARLMAANLDAHSREVRATADQLPDGSYGQRNRLEIGDRNERISSRLRAVERSYQDTVHKEYWGY